ncbi:MAG: helix-hairpin-helix domain-containing protein, partial [Flavobacteriales bacterium]|nr:helix-hairpin-helix domain-containing protein [Flavobacteriales bacterium]
MERIDLTSLFSGVFLCFFAALSAQTEQKDIIEQSIEVIAEINEDSEVDYTTLIDDLTYFLERPLDINQAQREDFQALGFVTDIQIDRILSHRETFGRFIALEELQSVAGLPWNVILMLRNFTSVNRDLDDLNITMKDLLQNSEHELFLRTDRILEELKGSGPISSDELEENPNSRFLGSPWRHYVRYRMRYQNRVSIGFTAEKDVGEEFFTGTQKNGFDYYSFHAYASRIGKIDKVAIGDYQIQMGQGMTMWSGLAFGKSANLFSIKRNGRGVVPYRSVDENNFLRGAAVTLKHGDFDLTLFGSKKKRDANLLTGDTLDPEQAVSFSALQINGFHRIPREVADKNVLGETIYGAELKWSHKGFRAGVRGVKLDLDREFQVSPSDYNQFFFRGQELSVLGADYEYVKGNLNIFGEVSRSSNGALSAINGAYLVLDRRMTLAVLHRTVAKDFQAVYANPIIEGSRVSNEHGLLMGTVIRPDNKWTITTWMDRFSFPWLRFQVDAPSSGFEFLGQVVYRPNRRVEAYFRYRYRERPRNVDVEDLAIDQVGQTVQRNYRLNTRYRISETVQLRSRVELTDFYREGRT